METDDVYPNDGTFIGGVPLEPVEQVIERKSEKAQTLQALPELKKMITRLDERIKWYETTTNIPDEVRTNTKEFLITHNSYSATAKALTEERNYLQDLIDAYAKRV